MSTCCNADKVKARCTDVRVLIQLVADSDGAVLVDDSNTAFMLGVTRTATQEFEFNRQLPPETP